MSQAAFAERMGIRQATISDWETGNKSLPQWPDDFWIKLRAQPMITLFHPESNFCCHTCWS